MADLKILYRYSDSTCGSCGDYLGFWAKRTAVPKWNLGKLKTGDIVPPHGCWMLLDLRVIMAEKVS